MSNSNVAKENIDLSALLDVKNMVKPRNPERFSILAYFFQFCRMFASSESDSGISSLTQSRSSSFGEVKFGGRRNISFDLLDGRRARSLSCLGRKRRGSEDSYAEYSPLHQKNTFKDNIEPVASEFAVIHQNEIFPEQVQLNTKRIDADQNCVKTQNLNPKVSWCVESTHPGKLNDSGPRRKISFEQERKGIQSFDEKRRSKSVSTLGRQNQNYRSSLCQGLSNDLNDSGTRRKISFEQERGRIQPTGPSVAKTSIIFHYITFI